MSFGSKKIHNKLFLICFTTILCMTVSGCDLNNKTEAKTDIQPTEEASNDSEEKNFNKNRREAPTYKQNVVVEEEMILSRKTASVVVRS